MVQKAFKKRSTDSRRSAIAAIQICWKKMRPDLSHDKELDREERLAWIAQYLGLKKLGSITDLSDTDLFSTAGRMKELTGSSKPQPRPARKPVERLTVSGGAEIIQFPGTRNVVDLEPAAGGGADVDHSATPEQIYTLEKLHTYIGWSAEGMAKFMKARFKTEVFQMLRYKQAHALTMLLLNIAAHQDLKKLDPSASVSRADTAKYIPKLKRKLRIDQ